MRVIYGFDSIPAISHAVATVGSYDGVHSGHRVLIEQVIARAKARGGDSVVVTFEPHPRITLGKAEGLKLLTTLEEKALLLDRLGVDFMVVIPFDLAFSRLSHQQFIEQYLIGKLGIEELVVGY
ncbi:MAG: FAD synthase, partial [Alistipes sp.]|nr:FAD synthase [Alistipes sp.]